MNTITQNETKFDSLFLNCSKQNNEYFLHEFSYLLEKFDDYLFSKRKDLTANGKEYAGLSRNQICIGVGYDGIHTYAFIEGKGKQIRIKRMHAF